VSIAGGAISTAIKILDFFLRQIEVIGLTFFGIMLTEIGLLNKFKLAQDE